MTQAFSTISPDTLSVFNQQVKYFKLALDLANNIKPLLFNLLDKWNGKIYTKRFATALEKEFPYNDTGLWISRCPYTGNVDFSFYNQKERSIHSVETEWLTNYISEDKVYFLTMYADTQNQVTIDADKLKEMFNKRVDDLQNKVDTLSQYSESKLIETKNKYLEVKEYFENTVNVIPYTVRKALNIKLY